MTLSVIDRLVRSSRTWYDFFKQACALPAGAPGRKPDTGEAGKP